MYSCYQRGVFSAGTPSQHLVAAARPESSKLPGYWLMIGLYYTIVMLYYRVNLRNNLRWTGGKGGGLQSLVLVLDQSRVITSYNGGICKIQPMATYVIVIWNMDPLIGPLVFITHNTKTSNSCCTNLKQSYWSLQNTVITHFFQLNRNIR